MHPERVRKFRLAALFFWISVIILIIFGSDINEAGGDDVTVPKFLAVLLFFVTLFFWFYYTLGALLGNFENKDGTSSSVARSASSQSLLIAPHEKRTERSKASKGRKTAKKSHITEYTNNLYFFYTKDYPSNFSGPLTNSMGGFDPSDLSPEFRKAVGNLSVPSPQQWVSLQNNSTKGINPPTKFKLNERLFFILIHGFVSSFQSIIEHDNEEPFLGLTKSKINFHTEESRRAFFEEHSKDIEEITGRSSSYEQYESVLEHYKHIYHDKIKEAICGTSTTMMVNLGFDFRIGMKAGILNTEVIIESLYISGFRDVLKSFYSLLNKKVEYFSDGTINGYCKDLLYRYSKISRIKNGTKMTEVNFSFRATKKEMRNNLLDTSSGLFNFGDFTEQGFALQIGISRDKPDDLKKFKKEYKELKNKATKFTEIK